MRSLIVGIFSLCGCANSFAGQWIVLNPSNIDNFQITQAVNSTGAPEALFIGIKADITGEAASYCSRKNFIAISDPKLIDRIYSGLLFGIASQKTMQFWADGTGKCVANIPLVTMFLMYP